jgi:hypothetical protein
MSRVRFFNGGKIFKIDAAPLRMSVDRSQGSSFRAKGATPGAATL